MEKRAYRNVIDAGILYGKRGAKKYTLKLECGHTEIRNARKQKVIGKAYCISIQPHRVRCFLCENAK